MSTSRSIKSRLLIGIFLIVLASLCAQRAQVAGAATDNEKVGVTATEITIGSCCSLSGNLAERGHQLALGANLYLNAVNEQGGVNGRKIKLVQCDDKYDPEAAITCFNSCLKDKVFAGSFFVGSPPISKYVRMADTMQMPLFGFCTGTPIVYEPHPTIFVLRRGYADEVERQIVELYKNHAIKKIAVVYQNDAFGAAVRESALKALSRFGAQPIVEASYSRRTQDIDDAYKVLRGAHPEAVIVGATSDAFKSLIRRKNQDNWNPIFVGLSVADDYVEELGKAADGMVLTQVVPLMDNQSLPAAKEFAKLRAKYEPNAQAAATAFEAYLNAEVLVEALKRAGKDPTRSAFTKAMESIHNFDVGAGSKFKVSFSHDNHVGWPADSVYTTIIKDGKPMQIQDNDWKALVKSVKAGT